MVSKPRVLDLALRLHIEIAECHRIIGDLRMCLNTLQDAYMVSVEAKTSLSIILNFSG